MAVVVAVLRVMLELVLILSLLVQIFLWFVNNLRFNLALSGAGRVGLSLIHI